MASTFSPNLRLELIGTGEQQGTWGSTTNTNLGTLLEEAIGGYVSVTVADSGDTTLSVANGSADQSRNMVINLVGALTANRNVICPAIEKIYVVKNSTTGGFDVTFKVSGQTGVLVPNGTTVFLYVNGTDAAPVTGTIASQYSSNVSITGGTVTGISNLSSNNATITGGTITGLSNLSSSNISSNNVSFTGGTATGLTSLGASNVNITSGTITGTSISSSNATITGGDITGLSNLASNNVAITGGSISNVSITGATVTGVTNLTSNNVTITGGTITGVTNVESTNFNVGNASDTTITRVSAGVIAVEGNQVPSPGSVAQGDVLYYNGTVWTRLGAGTSGQFLKTNGPSANPAWANATSSTLSFASGLLFGS